MLLGMHGRRNGHPLLAGEAVGMQVGRGSSRPQALNTPGLRGSEAWRTMVSHRWTSSKGIHLCSDPLCQPWPPSETPPQSGAPPQHLGGPGRVVGVQRERGMGTHFFALGPGQTSPPATAMPVRMLSVNTGGVTFTCLEVKQFPE